MSFRNFVGGCAVIHADFLHSARRSHFTSELARVGISDPEIIQARRILDGDPRLATYSGRANGLVSLIDGFLSALDLAESRKWHSIAIFEDDIAFRPDFTRRWNAVEPEAADTEWGILTLHRTPIKKLLLPHSVIGTRLVKIDQNTLTHCMIVRAGYYSAFRESLEWCLRRGWPADFFYGVFGELKPGRLWATSRNLSGQAAFPSSLQATGRRANRYSMFRSANPLECAIINPLHGAWRTMRSALSL